MEPEPSPRVRGDLDQDGDTINIFRLKALAARLLRSARLLRMNLPCDVGAVSQILIELVQKNAPTTDVYFRPVVYKFSL